MPLDVQYPYTGIEVLGCILSFTSFSNCRARTTPVRVSFNLLYDDQSVRYPECFCKQRGRGRKAIGR